MSMRNDFSAGFRGIADRQCADIAYEDIDAAELGGRAVNPLLEGDGIGDIGRLAPGLDALRLQGRNDAVDLLLLSRANGDVGALASEHIRNRTTDSLASARHESVRALQSQIHGSLLG
jgi:hypothetical protein